MPTDVSILTNTLKAFLDVFLSGYSRIHESAINLLHLLGLIDLVLAAIFALWSREGEFTWLAQKVLAYGFWILLVSQWITLMPTVINGFVWVGLRAGGSTVTVAEFTNPTEIAKLGLVATEPIWNHIRNYGWSAALHTIDILISGLCGLVILACFFAIAIELFVFFLQFYFFAVLAIILVPFGINRYTSWIADGTFSTLLAHGIKVMALAFLTSAIFPLLHQLTLPPDPTWTHLFSMVCAVLAILALCLVLPRSAVNMFTHGPQLTAGVFAGAVLGATMLTGTVSHMLGHSGRSAAGAASRLMPRRGGSPGLQGGGVRPQTP